MLLTVPFVLFCLQYPREETILPGLTSSVILVIPSKEPRSLKTFTCDPSVIFLISSPWYINIHYLTDGIWTEGFFLKHNVSRFTNTMEGHGGSIFKTLGFILLGLFPFSIFIPQSLIHIFTRVRKQENLFLLIICSVFTLFFGISATKLPNYTMPSYPFFAMGIAVFLNYSIKKNKEKALIPAQLIIVIIGSLIPLIVYIYSINNEDV